MINETVKASGTLKKRVFLYMPQLSSITSHTGGMGVGQRYVDITYDVIFRVRWENICEMVEIWNRKGYIGFYVVQ